MDGFKKPLNRQGTEERMLESEMSEKQLLESKLNNLRIDILRDKYSRLVAQHELCREKITRVEKENTLLRVEREELEVYLKRTESDVQRMQDMLVPLMKEQQEFSANITKAAKAYSFIKRQLELTERNRDIFLDHYRKLWTAYTEIRENSAPDMEIKAPLDLMAQLEDHNDHQQMNGGPDLNTSFKHQS